MDEALGLLRHSACGSAVQVQYSGAGGASVLARPGNVQEILLNILLNAAQAMGGSGTIEARSRVENERLVISIRDHGPGIAPEHLARVFDPFFTTKQAGQGTGLGLAISYELAQELGGTIRAFNPPEGGACFAIELPLFAEAP
jgi:signal transduction histidine kinase